VSVYVQATIGPGRYLLEATGIIKVRQATDPDAAVCWQGEALPRVDLRTLFGADTAAAGCCILVRQASGAAAALFVDGVEGLVEIGRSEWRPLPPIGPLGQLIDAVSTIIAHERPMLRLRSEQALAASFGRDTAAGADRG
jgi:chemotaxis signal transduction protein